MKTILTRTLFILAASVCVHSGLAQEVNKPDSLGIFIEDGFIEKMDKYASYKIALTNDIEAFMVDTETNDYEIFPNTSSLLRLSFNYSFISFNVKFGPSFLPGNGDEEEQGKTATINIGTDLIFRHWIQTLNYTAVKGYYLNNTKNYDPAWQKGDPYIQFPKLHYIAFQGSTGYSFNSKFSTKAITTQTERQVKSAGSFIPLIGYRYYIIDNREEFSATVTSTQKSDNFEIGLGAGYHYTFVIKQDFYLSLGATPSFGYLFMKLHTRTATDEVVSRQQDPLYRLEGRGAIGYNGVRLFTGLLVGFNSAVYEQGNSHVINSDARAYYQLHVGYRFVAPKKLREKMAYIEGYRKPGK